MIKKSFLILATTFAAGLLFVNIYTSLVDAASWGSNFPASIQTARDYFHTVNPGFFFRIFSPANQVLTLLALIICWKPNKKVRMFCVLAFLTAIAADALTFTYFYPRNAVMFASPLPANLDAVKTALSEWTVMNWFRSLLIAANLIFDFLALMLVAKIEK